MEFPKISITKSFDHKADTVRYVENLLLKRDDLLPLIITIVPVKSGESSVFTVTTKWSEGTPMQLSLPGLEST